MRTLLFKGLSLAGLIATCLPAVEGQTPILFEVNQAIPDGDLVGIVDTREVSGLPDVSMVAVEVQLTLSGLGDDGFLGDLYISLWHDGQLVVLLNRLGRTAINPFGYSDSANVSITLSATAAGDIHLYREALGDPDTPLTGSLLGVWQPDGRATDPLNVVDTDPRTAGLSFSQSVLPNGKWALHVIDTSAGGEAQLVSWGVTITSVPEPAMVSAVLAICLLVWRLIRTRSVRGDRL